MEDSDREDFMPLVKRKRLLQSKEPSPSRHNPVRKRVTPVDPQKWPGLPRGVKFDPSDEDLLWHLLAALGKGDITPHPFISEFIITLDDSDDFSCSHPSKLPGIKQDGSASYYFHRSVESYDNRKRKHQKLQNDNTTTTRWDEVGKSKPLYMDGIQIGSKRVLALNAHCEKSQKWVMHQFYAGIEEDEEFVVSKIFCQLECKSCDSTAKDLPTVHAVGTEPRAAQFSFASVEVPSQNAPSSCALDAMDPNEYVAKEETQSANAEELHDLRVNAEVSHGERNVQSLKTVEREACKSTPTASIASEQSVIIGGEHVPLIAKLPHIPHISESLLPVKAEPFNENHTDTSHPYSSGRCKLDKKHKSGSKCADDRSDVRQSSGLDENRESENVLSFTPREVKVEPSEENMDVTPVKNSENLPSPTVPAGTTETFRGLDLCTSQGSSYLSSEHMESGLTDPLGQTIMMKSECVEEIVNDALDHIPLSMRMRAFKTVSEPRLPIDMKSSLPTAQSTFRRDSFDSVNVAKKLSRRSKKKKTATNSAKTALDEDAPGLLQVLLDRGITAEEIKLYGATGDDEDLPSSTEDSFEELEAIITKIFSEGPSFMKLSMARNTKGSKAIYCLYCLISLIEQVRYLRFRNTPVEWGWCRDLQSFIFVFESHNRIVLERPEYGYATYFFELIATLPIDWQIKRLVTTMKLPCCGRAILLENRCLMVGDDLSEGEARVLEEFGWTPNTGIGTLLSYCDRVVHDRKNEVYNEEWRSKIVKILMQGHDSGQTFLSRCPKRVGYYDGNQDLEVKPESSWD